MADEFFNRTVAALAAAGIDSPRLEARILLAHVTGMESNVYDPGRKLSPRQMSEAGWLLERRLAHEPLDKVIGRRDFYKYRFVVNREVLSPRPDSETLVEAAAELIAEHRLSSLLELGVGSGCLLLSLLADCPGTRGVGADISPAVLAVAAENARRLKVEDRLRLVEFDYFKDVFSERFDLIVSNPPYIPSADVAFLAPEVKDYDPLSALDGGADGLDHYRQIASVAGGWLNDGGYLVLEAGAGQAGDIASVFAGSGWQTVGMREDLNGIKRCVILKK